MTAFKQAEYRNNGRALEVSVEEHNATEELPHAVDTCGDPRSGNPSEHQGCQWFVPIQDSSNAATRQHGGQRSLEILDGEEKCGRRIVPGLPLDAPYCWYHASLAFQNETSWRRENRLALELRWHLTDVMNFMHVVTDEEVLPE